MKKIIFIFYFIFIITYLNAQVYDRRQNFYFGIKAGVNYSNVWDERGQEFAASAKFGIAAGVLAGIPLNEKFGFQPEVLISQKGFKGSGVLFGSSYSFSRTSTFVDVPLFAQYKPLSFIAIVAGPQFSYLIEQKDEFTFGASHIEQQQEFASDGIRKNILGFVGGVDFLFSFLIISGRAGIDFQTNNGDGTSMTPRYKNQWLQWTLGFRM